MSALSVLKTPVVVAIDGPSGSGKSTQSRRLAHRLGLQYLDTGAMYRAALWWCVTSGVDLTDAGQVAAAVAQCDIEVSTDSQKPFVRAQGVDITDVIREPWVSAQVSAVAVNLLVRDDLVARQQGMIADACRNGLGIVAEGRDICSVVAPDADVKILLTADPIKRVERRHADVRGELVPDQVAATHAEVVQRDAQDATVANFFTAEAGVVEVDSSFREPDETHQALLDVVRAAGVIA